MKSIRNHAIALVLAIAAPLVSAADATDHEAHHPENAPSASAPKTPSKPVDTAKAAKDQSMKMDAQMKTMCEMHEKMMNAKTPEERNALMSDHMKAMKDGMSMMGGMSGSGMMGGPANGNKPASPQAMQQQMNMMQKKMDMMQTMMQMMMDRMEMQMPVK